MPCGPLSFHPRGLYAVTKKPRRPLRVRLSAMARSEHFRKRRIEGVFQGGVFQRFPRFSKFFRSFWPSGGTQESRGQKKTKKKSRDRRKAKFRVLMARPALGKTGKRTFPRCRQTFIGAGMWYPKNLLPTRPGTASKVTGGGCRKKKLGNFVKTSDLPPVPGQSFCPVRAIFRRQANLTARFEKWRAGGVNSDVKSIKRAPGRPRVWKRGVQSFFWPKRVITKKN